MAKDMYQKRKEIQENKKNETYEEKKTNINWYPGHMLKTKREIIEDLKLIDVVIEVLDARIPTSSQNPDIKKIISNKKRIIVLNKSDLAEKNASKEWIEYFKTENIIAIETDSNQGKNIACVLKKVEEVMVDDLEKAKDKGIAKKNIRILVLGIPNVGKSSFINRIANKKSAQVGNRPGVTKQKQWIRISHNIELLDTPGVLWPKFQDEKVGLDLAYVGTIKDDLIEKTEVAYSLLKYLYKNYKTNIILRYDLTKTDMDNIINSEEDKIVLLIDLIAKKRGAIQAGNNIDYEKVSNIILNDFRNGKLGRITLEKANER